MLDNFYVYQNAELHPCWNSHQNISQNRQAKIESYAPTLTVNHFSYRLLTFTPPAPAPAASPPVNPSLEHRKKRPRNKTKRPLPGKKWVKANSVKESLLDGMSCILQSILISVRKMEIDFLSQLCYGVLLW